MEKAIALSIENVRSGLGGPFAALVVRNGSILATGTNQVTTMLDPTAHAEVVAIRAACQAVSSFQLGDCEMYTTCEPCPMCMSCALWCELDRVVYGATIEDAKRHVLQIHIPAAEVAKRSDMSCIVDGPVLRDECYALFTHPNMLRAFREWATRRKKRPA